VSCSHIKEGACWTRAEIGRYRSNPCRWAWAAVKVRRGKRKAILSSGCSSRGIRSCHGQRAGIWRIPHPSETWLPLGKRAKRAEVLILPSPRMAARMQRAPLLPSARLPCFLLRGSPASFCAAPLTASSRNLVSVEFIEFQRTDVQRASLASFLYWVESASGSLLRQ